MIAACSFCLKPNDDVVTLVAGPGVYICNECVALCSELVKNKPAGIPRVAPWELASRPDEVLEALPKIAAARSQVDAHLASWVRRGRALGATWAAIGDALGMTRQSAWERFAAEG